MIKFCYVLDVQLTQNYSGLSLYFESGSHFIRLCKNQFKNITSCFTSQLCLILQSNSQTVASSRFIIPAQFDQNTTLAIELLSEASQKTFASVSIIFSVLPFDIFESFAKTSNELSEDLTSLQIEFETTKKHLNLLEVKEKISSSQLKHLQNLYEKSLIENELLRSRILDYESEINEQKIEKQLLLQENLEFQTEICDLHTKIWEKEKSIKSSLLLEEKKVLDLTHKHTEAITKLRNLEYSNQDLSLKNDSLFLKLTSLSDQIKLQEASTNEISIDTVTYDRVQELLGKQNLAWCNAQKTTNFKPPQAKLKDENKPKQTIDERFLEYLKIYELENEFERLADELYAYGNKRITVSVKGDSLVCRVGGGYMSIDEFLSGVALKLGEVEDKVLNIPETPTKFDKRKGLGVEEGMLKENINTPSPKGQKSLKFMSSGKKFSQTNTPLGKVGRMLYK